VSAHAWFVALFSLIAAGAAAGAEDARLHRLANELRCPVCQNQSLADSNADLARDLREEIARQLAAGRSDDEIRTLMVSRYGEFVLYDPPLQPNTLLLWGAPFALFALGAGALLWRLGGAAPDTEDEPAQAQRNEA
jgi:cytochrome c-type biogenesis protein CcmH